MAGDCIILIIAFLLTFQSFLADTINWYLDSRSDKKIPLHQGLSAAELYGDLVYSLKM